MKKFFSLLLVSIAISFSGYSQCVPDTSITHNVTGIYPDSATGLPHAFVGTSYVADIHLCVPATTTYAGQSVTVDSVRVTAVTGLPSGFTYSCTPSNCIFPGGATSCFQITGNAPTAGMIGNYPLEVSLKVSGRLLGIIPQQVDTTNGNYTIVIDDNIGVATLVPSTFQVSQNKPNPFFGKTDVIVSSPVSETIQIKVSDLIGNVLQTQSLRLPKGNNTVALTSEELRPGIYLYTITNGRSSFTRRMIVSGN